MRKKHTKSSKKPFACAIRGKQVVACADGPGDLPELHALAAKAGAQVVVASGGAVHSNPLADEGNPEYERATSCDCGYVRVDAQHWGNASAPVYIVLKDGGRRSTPFQVASFRHDDAETANATCEWLGGPCGRAQPNPGGARQRERGVRDYKDWKHGSHGELRDRSEHVREMAASRRRWAAPTTYGGSKRERDLRDARAILHDARQLRYAETAEQRLFPGYAADEARIRAGVKGNPRQPPGSWIIQGAYGFEPGRGWSVAPFAKPRTGAEAENAVADHFSSGHAAQSLRSPTGWAWVEIWKDNSPWTLKHRIFRDGAWGPWTKGFVQQSHSRPMPSHAVNSEGAPHPDITVPLRAGVRGNPAADKHKIIEMRDYNSGAHEWTGSLAEFIASNTAENVDPLSAAEIEALNRLQVGDCTHIAWSTICRIQ